MKKLIFTLCIGFLTAATFTSCKNDPKKEQQETTEKNTAKDEAVTISSSLQFSGPEIMEVFQGYLQIEKSLEKDDKEATSSYAQKMASELKPTYPVAASIADKIGQVANIEEQRMAFSELSSEIESILKENIKGGILYKQYCPMAFDGKGAYWIATVKEVNNPYMGKSMPHCGKNVGIIE